MGRRWFGGLLFVGAIGGCVALTLFVSEDASFSTMIYNAAFLGVMILICLVAVIGGLARMGKVNASLDAATRKLEQIQDESKEEKKNRFQNLGRIFSYKALRERMEKFLHDWYRSKVGLCDVEDYINDNEIDAIVKKRMLEMVPDILTSMGILGTFIGLVWGLRNFEPSNYEAMTTSVVSLVDGIKVAFLTSIYGLALSLVYSYCMRSEYSALMITLQRFIDTFHRHVAPSAEIESRNAMVAYQQEQTKMLQNMAQEFSKQLVQSFETTITPAFQKMNESLDVMLSTITRSQKEVMDELVGQFLKQLRESFHIEFAGFNAAVEEMASSQKRNVLYTEKLFQQLSVELNNSFLKEDHSMRQIVKEMTEIQKQYTQAMAETMQKNQELAEAQSESCRHTVAYMQESEEKSAKFWVACNQTMQKYLDAAAKSFSDVNEIEAKSRELLKTYESSQADLMDSLAALKEEFIGREGKVYSAFEELYKANEKLILNYNQRVGEFVDAQNMIFTVLRNMEDLLNQIEVSGASQSVQLRKETAATRETGSQISPIDQKTILNLKKVLEEEGERQSELLEDLNSIMKEFVRALQKNGKFSIFNK
ncbi:MAG: MotA/TolQ/ExbB proton channel family protein [Lachnospiraceae bacterium]|nr:MotA/TolQ/ExbB proton channel family protein [Robinsoniella sp.]MDY3765867.1 MotA/TolQ/ExbB proton channel family protein [Lachnospiraceae bacterium]